MEEKLNKFRKNIYGSVIISTLSGEIKGKRDFDTVN